MEASSSGVYFGSFDPFYDAPMYTIISYSIPIPKRFEVFSVAISKHHLGIFTDNVKITVTERIISMSVTHK